METEKGPVYGIELIESLPMGNGFTQAMPSRRDLCNARIHYQRVVAGYEVLLQHEMPVVPTSVFVGGAVQ